MHRFSTAIATIALAGASFGQDAPEPPAAEPTPGVAPTVEVSFAGDAASRAADMLTGVWQSGNTIDETGARIILSIAPVAFNGIDGTLYAEMSRSDDLANPYRQVLMQLYDFDGTLRLRTLEFRTEAGPALAGMSHIPDRFPQSITGDDVIATLDIDLSAEGDGFSGKTPYAYPTRSGGAVQMTSEISIDGASLTTVDTGFAADGTVVWGGDSGVTFSRADGLVDVLRLESPDWSHQFIQINYTEGEGEPVADGDFLALHYSGFLADGTKFDSSRDRGEPFRYLVPGRLIEGWLMGTEGIRQGAARRLIIPSELGYGSRANARIPANSTLLFDVEAIFIERAEQTGENPDEAEAIDGAAAEGE